MKRAIRLLLVEDSEDDARMVVRILERADFKVHYEIAGTRAATRAALAGQLWDAVISDYNMPDFNGLDALAIVRESLPDIPFILISGSVGEEIAVDALKAGVGDYVLKKNLSRLPSVLERELREAASRTEHRQVQRHLQESERHLRTIIESEPECVKLVSREGALLEMNSAGLAMLEAGSLAEARAQPLLDFIVPEHRAAFAALHQRVIRGESGILEFEIVGLKGGRRWLETHAAPLGGANGEEAMLLGLTRDVTERKRAEEDLRRFRLALDNSADIIIIVDRSTMRNVDVNETACRLLGYTREELLSVGPQDVLPMSRSELERKFDELIANPAQTAGMQSYYRCKDGSQLPFESSRHVLRSGERWLIVAVSRDIRVRLAAETALRETQERYRRVVEVSPDAICVLQNAKVVFANQAALKLFGAPDAAALIGQSVFALTHPDFRSAAFGRLRALEAGAASNPSIEQVFLRLDGTPVDVEVASARFVQDGEPAVLSIVRDVTERKKSDEALRRFQMAMDVSADSIYLTDPASMRFVYVNDTACKRLGYTREQLLQMGPADVRPGGAAKISGEYAEVIAAGEQALVHESRYTRSDGSEGWTELHRRALRTESGTLIVTIGRDITERKAQHEKIERLTRVYAVLSGINSAIVRIQDRAELFREACRIAVEAGQFKGAWLGIAERESGRVNPVAWQGLDDAYIRSLPANLAQSGRRVSLAAQAVRDRRPVIAEDMAVDARVQRKDEARTRGLHSLAILPLFVAGEVFGVLTLYATESGFFDEEEMKLLCGLADDLSFALDNLEKAERLKIEGAERSRAEARVIRLNRTYAMLSGINSAIVRIRERNELFRETCRIAVSEGGFILARVIELDARGRADIAATTESDWRSYQRLVDRYNADPEHSPSLLGLALRDGQPLVSNDVAGDARIPDRVELTKDGNYSLALLPISVGKRVAGALVLRARVAGAFDDDELRLLLELVANLSFALELMDKQQKLDYLAYYDALTGLANRSLFLDRLNQSVRAAAPAGNKVALVLADLERLRTINESLGRPAGDVLLKEVAQRLSLAAGSGEVARLGVDNFALMLQGIKGKSEVTRRLEQLWQDCFGKSFRLGESEVRMSAKAGVALYPNDGANAETLLGNAEAALRRAKQTGERHVFHTLEMTAKTGEKLALENSLRQALEKNEFLLHYQPKADLITRRIVAVEALIRWQSPALGLVPPGRFIPLLEETGLILEVGAWALARAVADHSRWLGMGMAAPRIAVNVSAIQLRRRDFVATVEQALARGAKPPGIDLEITESLLMEDIQGNIAKLKAIRALGLSIAIDDFGTGYSSLGYLARLPIQTLKIDRSFIITMLTDPDTMTLVSTIISLAHSLRLNVIAEGVEAEEQAKVLRLLRCDEMQGYLFSRPVPFDEMTAQLKREVKAA